MRDLVERAFRHSMRRTFCSICRVPAHLSCVHCCKTQPLGGSLGPDKPGDKQINVKQSRGNICTTKSSKLLDIIIQESGAERVYRISLFFFFFTPQYIVNLFNNRFEYAECVNVSFLRYNYMQIVDMVDGLPCLICSW